MFSLLILDHAKMFMILYNNKKSYIFSVLLESPVRLRSAVLLLTERKSVSVQVRQVGQCTSLGLS